TPEDVAGSALRVFWRGVRRDRFSRLSNRDDLWRILGALTLRKAIDKDRQGRAAKRGGGVAGKGLLRQLSPDFAADDPLPHEICEGQDEFDRLMRLLPNEGLRQIVRWRMEQYTTEEIARMADVTPRTIERKLALVRELLDGEQNRPA
ncbi:MAG TPA: ECF-type sigma factor, partial [Planctomycetaceae bacterium]|nr:ECF-type sigma factor [Planctomycetaceae bacterium]